MPRKLLALACVIVGLHILAILTLGTSSAGGMLANSLQIFSCGLAAAACFGASRRGRGLSRPFWTLAGCGMAMWGVANIGWMYYENWLHVAVPSFSIVRILFDVQGVFFAIALFLDQERDSPSFDLETLLDSLQIAIVFLSVFFGLYVQFLRGASDSASAWAQSWIFDVINVALAAMAVIRMLSAPTRRLRTLYSGLLFFLVIYASSSGIADYMEDVRHVPTGTWYDLYWTVPFLLAAVWAARWKEPEEQAPVASHPRKNLARLAFKNVTLALAPLIVASLLSQVGPEWRRTSFALLAMSILCFATRLGLSEFRLSDSAEIARRNWLAMDSAINGMAILDAGGKYIYVNSAYARMIGNTHREAVLGRSWREVPDARDVAPVLTQVRESLKQRGRWFGTMTVHHSNATVVHTEMAVTSLPDGGTICVSHDITERVSAQIARDETETKYRMLIEQVAAISYIAEIGVAGQWFYVSPQIETMFGYSPEEWLASSRDWLRYIPVEDHPIVFAAEEANARGERSQSEFRIIRKDGQTIWVNDTAVVVRGSDRHPVVEGLIVDITDRKMLENQLLQARKMEAVGRLAGGVAHDFNNLLTIIKGYVEMALQRCMDRPDLHGDIRRIENAADRAVNLVRQLLAFSRKQVLRPKILDLNAIVVNLDQLLRRLMNANIEMKTFVSQGVGAIKADPGQIEQVIMNLVVNARDALPGGGRILIETSNVDLDSSYTLDHAIVRPGPYVLLAVTDTGVGMTADTVAHIFEPFYTTKESGRGTGLGLSTVYGIVKQSGGYIWVYSELGRGTTFKVYLPRVQDSVPASPAPEMPPATAPQGRETILLVEDEPAVRELIQMVLSERGYKVLEALVPEDAERLAGSNGAEIQLLLTDVVMPGMSGRDLAKRLTARHPNLRVLYMSGYTFNVIAQDGTLEEGISFLQKPFTPQVLTEKVREALDRSVPAK
jgi:two-component system cell cycle sensor histidine kinase/response regulator CckA